MLRGVKEGVKSEIRINFTPRMKACHVSRWGPDMNTRVHVGCYHWLRVVLEMNRRGQAREQ